MRTMRTLCWRVMLVGVLGGCERPALSDPVVPIKDVPVKVMDVARQQLPGYTFDTAYRIQVNGVDAYEIRGKDKRGKIREVEVSSTGEVLEIE